ncbi:MAG: IS21 family transposase [Planctomycetota bacterium]
MRARLTPEEIVSIQVLVSKGVPVRDITRKLGKPESTVRHHAHREGGDRQDGRQNKVAKCDEHASAIQAWVATHARGERPTNVRDLYEWLVTERGYTGSYKSVVRWSRRHWGQPRVRTYRRVETPPGAQSQSDWGHFSPLIVAKEQVTPMAFVMTLSFSRRTAVAWSPSRALMAWIGCHNRAYAQLGGVAATNRIDNEKTAMIEGAGAWGRIHPVYQAYSRQMRFHVDACGPRQPQAKGKVESKVKLTRTVAPSRAEYDSWEELETETAQRLDALSKRTRCRRRARTCTTRGNRSERSWAPCHRCSRSRSISS